ncbi:hypothetical protein HNE05_05135 [Aquipseudomonas campi]|uniref:Uncharacterized protein n=1 Tax=Aquipseudomonas campi TaxID=2731681 RepID=A0A6M8FCY9_9GAMM|nr:hypothetical protein [Pseudomonas campi]QKE62767.1 hypothetical protein HNE05_05135 [Pseudomonas campi]
MKSDLKARMVEATLWALWWLMIGSAAVWLLVGSVAYWVKHGWLPADSAGWAQAIGAMAAIAVAIVVPWRLRAAEQRSRQDDRRAVEIGQYIQLIKVINTAERFVGELRNGRNGYSYGATRLLLYSLLQDIQQQFSTLLLATGDRLLLKHIQDVKVAIARFSDRIHPDDISNTQDVSNLLNGLRAARSSLEGYVASEELFKPHSVGITG